MAPSTPQPVRTKEELIALIFELLDHNDAVVWTNDTAYSFLQAVAEWLAESPGADTASWQLFADAIHAAAASEQLADNALPNTVLEQSKASPRVRLTVLAQQVASLRGHLPVGVVASGHVAPGLRSSTPDPLGRPWSQF